MSRTVESKVVEMKFDNSNFEKNVQTSLGTLAKLKEGLQFSKVKNSFSAISDAAGKLDFSGLMVATETVTTKFSALEAIATGALMRIGQRAIDTGINLVKGMSVDQLAEGYNKLSQKNSSVQTLMNSTGKSMDEINEYLESLMWYSDETSFSFTDMTSALSTMVSSGGDIEKLIPMIMGMGNATAYAGKGAGEFSRVIYNLNQSYSQGFLSTMDWRSVEGAGAASIQLKNYLMEAAEELGDIQKGTADVSKWADYLSHKQISSEAMEIAFNRFAEYTNAVKEKVDDGTFETATQAMEKMGDVGFEDVGVKAFKAAQQAKTFEDAIDATKDAVSSGWMTIWEKIFGDFEQQTVLWTDFCNDLWDIFASGFEDKIDFIGTIMGDTAIGRYNTLEWDMTGSPLGPAIKDLENIISLDSELEQTVNDVGGIYEAMRQGIVPAQYYGQALEQTADAAEKTKEKYADVIDEMFNFTGMQKEAIVSTLHYGQVHGKFNEEFLEQVNGLAEGDEKQAKKILEYYDKIGYDLEIFTDEEIASMREIGASLKTGEGEYYDLYKAQKLFYEDYDENSDSWMTGRDYLIGSFFNVLHSFMGILEAVKAAWQDAFPAKTALQIQIILKSIHDFTKGLVPTELQVGLLRATFRGFFNILGIGKDALSAAFSIFKRFFGLFKVDGQETLKKVAAIANKITAFRESLQESKVFETFADNIFNHLVKIPEVLKMVIGKLLDFKKTTKDFIENNKLIQGAIAKFQEFRAGPSIFERMAPALEKVKSILITIKDHVGAFINSFTKFEWIVTLFSKLYNLLHNIAKTILTLVGGALKNLGEVLKNALTNLNFSDSASFFADIIGIGILGGIKKLIDNLKELGGIHDVVDAFKEDLAGIGEALGALSFDIQADALLKIAEAVGILALSLLLLSGIESENLIKAVSALTTLMTEVAGMLLLISNLGTEVTSPEGFFGAFSKAGTAQVAGKAMFNVAKSILVLAAALWIIAQIDPYELGAAFIVVTNLLAELTAVGFVLSRYSGEMTKGSKGLTKMAVAVLILAAAIKVIAGIDPKQLLFSVLAITVLIEGLTMSMIALSQFGGKALGKGTALALIGMAAAIAILAGVVFIFGKMKLSTLVQGMTAVVIALGALTAAAFALGKVGKGGSILAASLGMILMGAALLVLYEAVKLFGTLDIDVMNQGMMAVGSILMGFLILSSFAGGMVGGIFALAGGLLVLSVALLVLTPTLLVMGKNAGTISLGLLTLAGALIIFLGAAIVAGVVVPGILALSLGMIALSVSCALLGVGLAAIGAGFMMLATLGAVGAAGVISFLDVLIVGVIQFIPVIINAIIDGLASILKRLGQFIPIVVKLVTLLLSSLLDMLVTLLPKVLMIVSILITGILLIVSTALKLLLKMLIDVVPLLIELVTVTIVAICDCVITLIPKFLEVVETLLTSTLDFLVTMIPRVVESGLLMLAGFLEGIANGLPEVINAAFDVVISFINGLATALDEKGDDLIDAVWNLLTSIWDFIKRTITNAIPKFKEKAQELMESGFVQGIKAKFALVKDKAKEAIDKFKEGVAAKIADMKDAAKDIVQGLINGVKDRFNEIIDMGEELGSKILNGIKDFLHINSPSKTMAEIGRYTDEGLIVGLKKYSDKVGNAAEDVGETALDGMQNSLNKGISKVFDDADAFDPVIRPTLDLSQVSDGASAINGMFDANPIGVNGQLLQNGTEDALRASIEQYGITSKENVDAIVRAIKASKSDVELTLKGDADKFFSVVRNKNTQFAKRNGYSGFAL